MKTLHKAIIYFVSVFVFAYLSACFVLWSFPADLGSLDPDTRGQFLLVTVVIALLAFKIVFADEEVKDT